ncbi:hypothetical protein JW964_24085 [candidate division KSB1 bacterium]|nr:hypothetical protein [candidate division KSB1 bacterium]
MSYYLVRISEGSKYVEEGKKGGFIGICYGQVPITKILFTPATFKIIPSN